MPTIVSTPGAANANSYLTVDEADTYHEGRLPLKPAWDDSDDKTVNLVMATRMIDAMFRGTKRLVNGEYYIVGRTWTGAPSTTTQKLAWPRTGMLDQNGNAIASDVIPQDLKDAVAEFAGQLNKTDRTLDSDVAVQGLTSIRAGSVSLSFKDTVVPQVVPDAVINLIPTSWYTEETIESVTMAQFDVIQDEDAVTEETQ